MLKPYTINPNLTETEWKFAIQVRPKNLLSQNEKLAKGKIWQFSLPAAEASIVQGGKVVKMKTCPGASSCLNWCYAQQGPFNFLGSMVAHARNLQYVLDKPFDFAEQMIDEIKRKKVIKAVRWHDSGDFFSRAYFMVCKSIMEACPEINFYCYSKVLPLLKKLESEGHFPKNFTVVYSQGGKFDHLIDMAKDRHSRVFSSMKECLSAGYIVNNYNDVYAINKKILKIGLVFHATVTYKKKTSKAIKEMIKTNIMSRAAG